VPRAIDKYSDLFDFAPVGYFVWNHDGRILEVNLLGADLLGLDRSTATQMRFTQFVALDGGGKVDQHVACRRIGGPAYVILLGAQQLRTHSHGHRRPRRPVPWACRAVLGQKLCTPLITRQLLPAAQPETQAAEQAGGEQRQRARFRHGGNARGH
jgi:hypothetical protein